MEEYPADTNRGKSHPASTVYCPKTSNNQVCGIEFHHTIYNTDMRQIWPQDTIRYVDVETCHQRRLGDAACHSFLIENSSTGGDIIDCSLFGENLGINGTRAEHPPTPLATPSANGWYDRNCPEFLPVGFTTFFPINPPILSCVKQVAN